MTIYKTITHITTVVMCLALVLLTAPHTFAQSAVTVTPFGETEPVIGLCDSADDAAVWIHPTDPSQSLIIGTDKKGFASGSCPEGSSSITGGLEVYDLQGTKLQVISGMPTGNVDLRYNFPLAGQRVAIVVATNELLTPNIFRIYKVNPTTRRLEEVSARDIQTSGKGIAMYVSPVSGKYYAFLSGNGKVQQFELKEVAGGKVDATLVRTITLSSGSAEGVAADDQLQTIYISEETKGVKKLSAEPNGPTSATIWMDRVTSDGGHLTPDVEGIAIYYKSNNVGYILVSSQNADSYDVYRREGNNEYLGRFTVAASTSVDEVTHTDGIDVTNFPLGPNYPQGVFIAQDDTNKTSSGSKLNKNYKLVRWQDIASKLNLTSDTSWDPRKVGGNGQPPQTPNPVTPSPSTSPSPDNSCKVQIPSARSRIESTFTAPATGEYKIWSRIISNGGNANSYYLQIDNNCPILIGDNDDIEPDVWTWVDYRDAQTANKVMVNLTAGQHAIKLIENESETKLDNVLFTRNISCVPEGFGENCTTVNPTQSPIVTKTPTPTRTPQISNTPRPTVIPTTTPVSTPRPTQPPNTTTRAILPLIADTYVNQNNAGRNYGNNQIMQVDNNPVKLALLKFNLNNISRNNIKKAELTIKGQMQNGEYKIRETAANWDENRVTYSSRPRQGEVITTFHIRNNNTTKSIDLTEYIKNVDSEVISLQIETKERTTMDLSTHETDKTPTLIIRYNE